ncbi:hypothetical protein [Pseudoxanthomonas indica]|uniref:Uncharacterized protein n=1 Tax=Pseudoxanthomonas indica TaxID=428993 RepID=A0A1T5K962_9GAMM|nr:hypothetical protein [Pseudoxanthomonas indica]GGD47692.1 hypothetical protein GCM10007235_19520 [Pseudoxanthomonas indica]SKC60312.1 hypothetical protein SAMN06296058_1493 [Pseudoxanthomonas indica]
MTTTSRDLTLLLSQVGIVEHGPQIDLLPGVAAKVYRSSYVRLYIALCEQDTELNWPEIVRIVDKKVLEDIRGEELKDGGVVDAHVCFVANDAESASLWALRNERTVRNVSRKYWLSTSEFPSQLLNRLPILPISDPPNVQRSETLQLAADDSNWLDSLIAEGPSLTFTKFTSNLDSN